MLNHLNGKSFVLSLPIFMAFIGMVTVAALAKTPDGITPAEEEVCEGLSGRAYGLCNAYCEAKDCDSPDHRASDRTCEINLEHYQDETGYPGPPCDCRGVCADEKSECLAECTPDDCPCINACSNRESRCQASCCGQDCNISTQRCIDECKKGDQECIESCGFCICFFSISICSSPAVPVPDQ